MGHHGGLDCSSDLFVQEVATPGNEVPLAPPAAGYSSGACFFCIAVWTILPAFVLTKPLPSHLFSQHSA